MIVDKEFISYFKLAHGLFNLTMVVLFFYQAWLGVVIRRARLAGAPLPFAAVRRHRKGGPVFALWGVLGYIAGLIVVLLDKGRLIEYPGHFAVGTVVVGCIGLVYGVSRRIRGQAIPSRILHFRTGAVLLVLYVVQSVIGLSILL